MQTNVGLTGKTVVAGLNWSVIAKSGPGRKKDIRKACVDSGFTLGVTVDGADLAAIGLCAKKAEYPSGAAMLAAANALAVKERAFGDTSTSANWILVEKLKGGDRSGMYWMCAISDGVPVPGTDVVEDLTVTSAKLAELVEILENVEIFSIEQEILDYVAGASPSVEKGFADLTANVVIAKSLRPQKIVGIPDWVYLLVAGTCLLVAAGFGYNVWSEKQAQEERRRMEDAKKANIQKGLVEAELLKNKQYQEQDRAAQTAELNKISQQLAKSPAQVMKAWSMTVNSLPLNHGGWNVGSMTCDLVNCTVLLGRDESVGTNASLRELVPTAEFNEAGGASYVIPVKSASASRQVALDSLATWADFALTVGSSLQELKMSGLVEAKLGARKEMMYRPPALPSAPQAGGAMGAINSAVNGPAQASQPSAPKPLGIVSGNFSLSGSSFWQMDYSSEYLRSNEFSVDSLRIDFPRNMSADPSWSINGAYFLRSGVAGVIGSVGQQPRPVQSGQLPNGVGPMPPQNQPLPVQKAAVQK